MIAQIVLISVESPGAQVWAAQIFMAAASQLAAYAITQGKGEVALMLVNPQIAIAERHENAALLSSLMLLRAEALDLTGRTSEARAVRLDSMGWARYGYGADWAVRAKMREVSSLNPLKRN